VGNLADIGGSSSQQFFDDGTNGDTTPGDNIYAYRATIPAGTSTGAHFIVVVAADAQGRTVTMPATITVSGPTANEDPLILGNPSNATPDVANENNYLMAKPAYSLSYSRANNTPNWVAWRLDSSWIGSANNGEFAPDDTLPAGWYRVLPTDYSEPVYDRGHMCPAGDRTNTQANNSMTYLMTNIVPQHPDNNQGPWNDFENYCRSLANQGNELYIITGPQGNIGTIGSTAQNRVVVPAVTWKVVLVLPNGTNDLQRVWKGTRAFGIIMPNQPMNRNTPWRQFRVTVDRVEYLTGYDFFDRVPMNTQALIERRRDLQ
jgi:endonuclease G